MATIGEKTDCLMREMGEVKGAILGIDAKLDNYLKRQQEHHDALFGPDGLRGKLNSVAHEQSMHPLTCKTARTVERWTGNRAMAIAVLAALALLMAIAGNAIRLWTWVASHAS